MDKTKLRFGQYNVELLFLKAGTSVLVCPGNDCDWKNETIAQSHVQHVAEMIKKLDADIINLNEVQECSVLEAIIELIPEMNYKPYLVPGKDTFTGENAGILTRIDPMENLVRTEATQDYPVEHSTCPPPITKGTTGNSKHYQTRFNVTGLDAPLTLVATHLLAMPDDPKRCYSREAQAQILADEFLKKAKAAGDHIIMTGDMNDFDISVKDSNSNVPISSSLAILRDSSDLTNVASLIADQNERYSDWYDRDRDCVDRAGNEHSLIDHVLVSPKLFSKVKTVRVDHSYEQTCSCIYSDHWPVVVDFEL